MVWFSMTCAQGTQSSCTVQTTLKRLVVKHAICLNHATLINLNKKNHWKGKLLRVKVMQACHQHSIACQPSFASPEIIQRSAVLAQLLF